MKAKLILSAIFVSIALNFTIASACEIEVTVKGENAAIYNPGQVVVLQVKVFLTHKDCPEGIKSTKMNPTGMTLLGATKWKQISELEFIRLVQAKIDSSVTEAILNVGRSCDKEGGIGKILLKVGQGS